MCMHMVLYNRNCYFSVIAVFAEWLWKIQNESRDRLAQSLNPNCPRIQQCLAAEVWSSFTSTFPGLVCASQSSCGVPLLERSRKKVLQALHQFLKLKLGQFWQFYLQTLKITFISIYRLNSGQFGLKCRYINTIYSQIYTYQTVAAES